MKIFKERILAGLMALVVVIATHIAGAQNSRGCAWPNEFSPEGIGNATMPETLARYFVMPLDMQYDTMTIKGTWGLASLHQGAMSVNPVGGGK
jgi:hypothetical protein